MSKTIVIIMGLQGSGKSTFYNRYLADRFVRVNLDTLKTRYQEKCDVTVFCEITLL